MLGDKLAIRELIENWVMWRDGRMWDRFRTVWHSDGHMWATWFQGTYEEFIKVSQEGYDRGVRIMHMELAALIAQAKGQTDQAIALLNDAAALEESMRAPNGAADPIKPSHELLGEVLLKAGKAKEAADAFEVSLLRMPNRARSLMGAIAAHAAAGNKTKSAERLAIFNSFWKGKPFAAPTTEAR